MFPLVGSSDPAEAAVVSHGGTSKQQCGHTPRVASDRTNLFKGVLTGVMRIAKESMLSGWNNVGVRSVVHAGYATDFGLSPGAMWTNSPKTWVHRSIDEQRSWSDRYRFAGHTIHNPWSVMMYVANRENGFRPHGVVTGHEALPGRVRRVEHRLADMGVVFEPGHVVCCFDAPPRARPVGGTSLRSPCACKERLAVREFQRRERPSAQPLKRQPVPVTLPWYPRTRTLRQSSWRRHGARRPVTNTTHSSLASEPGYPVDGP